MINQVTFQNGNSYEYSFPTYIIKVARVNDDIVRVWFQNLQGVDIPVPAQTFHVDLQTRNVHNDFNGIFFITWYGRHTIVTNGIELIQFNNQRQVSVRSSCEHWSVRNATGQLISRNGQKIPQGPIMNTAQPEDQE